MTLHNSWTLDTLIEAYKQHQRRARGLCEQTLHGYERLIRLLVRAALGDDPIDPTRLSPSNVAEFVVSLRGRFSPCSMKAVRRALRSFFRFLRVHGLGADRLEAAIPTVAHWRLSRLPRSLSDEQLEQVLAAFDVAKPVRRRHHRHRHVVLFFCLRRALSSVIQAAGLEPIQARFAAELLVANGLAVNVYPQQHRLSYILPSDKGREAVRRSRSIAGRLERSRVGRSVR